MGLMLLFKPVMKRLGVMKDEKGGVFLGAREGLRPLHCFQCLEYYIIPGYSVSSTVHGLCTLV